MIGLEQAAIAAMAVVSVFALGLQSSPREALKQPKIGLAAGSAVVLNFVLVPAVAYVLLGAFGVSDAKSLGILLVAAAPGGGASAVFVLLARGSPMLGGTLVVGLATLTAFITPFVLALTAGVETSVPPAAVAKTVIVVQLIPLLIGMASRRWANKLGPWPSRLATALLLTVVIALTIRNGHLLLTLGWPAAAAILGTVAFSITAPLALRTLTREIRIAISMTAGVRNLALSLLLASLHFEDPNTTTAILCYGLFAFLTALPTATLFGRRAISGT